MTLAIRPTAAIVAAAGGSALPCYVTRAQAEAIIAAAKSKRDQLLARVLWESGGRLSEVLELRRGDVDREAAALQLANRKQRDPRRRRKVVYVSRDLAGELDLFARQWRMSPTSYYFRSAKSGGRWRAGGWDGGEPMSRQQGWQIITDLSRLAGVAVLDGPRTRAASPLDFRHGAAIDMLREGTPFPEVGTQLGHSRADSTLVYTRLVAQDRRDYADRRFGR